jgi:hypothetical protein
MCLLKRKLESKAAGHCIYMRLEGSEETVCVCYSISNVCGYLDSTDVRYSACQRWGNGVAASLVCVVILTVLVCGTVRVIAAETVLQHQ